MPVQDNVLLNRLTSSGIACNSRPSSTAFPFAATRSPAGAGTDTGTDPGTIVYSTFASLSYIEATPSSMNGHTSFSPATLDRTSSSTMTTDQLKVEISSTSPYYASPPYYSPSTSSSYSPSSCRESSYTPFSTVSESAPEATVFLYADHQQQQQCFPHEFTTTTTASANATAHDGQGQGQGGYLQRDTPPHQPLSMLSSIASLLPNQQHQHTNQGSGSIIIPTMIHIPRLRTQQPIHPPQSVCLSQSWAASTSHTQDFAPTPTPAPTSSTPRTPLQSSSFMSVPVPLQSPFAWSMPLSIPTPTLASPNPKSYTTSSPSGSTHSLVATNVRMLPSNAPSLSPNAVSYSPSPSSSSRPISFSPSSKSAHFPTLRALSTPSSNCLLSSSPYELPSNAPPRTSISPSSISPSAEQQLHQLYQFHQQSQQLCDCSSPIKRKQSVSPSTNRQAVSLMTPSDIDTPVETTRDKDSNPNTNYVDQYLSSENDEVKLEDTGHDEQIFLQAIEAAQERINLSPSRKRIRGPNAGVRRSAAELDGEEFANRGLARILVYADDNLRELVAQQNVIIREPHIYDADMMDLYCLSRGDSVYGRHFHTGDNCLKNQMGCRVALAVRYAYQSDLTETHLLWVDQIDRKDIPISIIMSFPACGNLIMRALKDDPAMGAQYRILRKQGYSDPPKASPREYGKIASLNRISWSIAFQNQSHMTTQAMGFLQRVSQAYQGAMGNPSRGMLKKRKMRAVVRESAEWQ
ncbi:hypothetical protein BG015_004367 [Linnemannia schmuckeri]|uniref:Uncharacterized protein n=1 Tax=Linnemannia schmuckeri TaxID=64567 RepID=A0A9P5S274_9FUNG|nr:hypothetical protein BG015_004367 [Linnemannia schmuckeri]